MPSGNPRGRQHGFTYLALLLAVTVVGIGLAAGSEVWSQSRQREKEQELLFVGEEFRRAIALYYERTPGAVKRYPQKLQDLLEDKRYVSLQRYLRKLYTDPLTGKPEWGLVPAPGGGIMGVYSKSQDRPLKIANFPEHYAAFEGARRYSQWQFVYQPTYNSAVLAPPAPSPEVR